MGLLDGKVAILLRLLQEGDGCRLRHETARREIVDLETLHEEIRIVVRRTVAEQSMRHRLQRHRSQTVATGD